MYYKRLIDSHLEEWRIDPFRKPLLLRGARQVGKSSAVRQLGLRFEDYIEINFEENPVFKTIFDKSLSVQGIVENLALHVGRPIVAGKTLLFLDEVQSCPAAISALRFFYEQMPELHVVAAGSLLEFALQALPSFGVGRVRSFFMFPFSFDEFLSATGERLLLEAKNKSSLSNPLPMDVHERLLEHLSAFMVIGGMPEVVVRFAQTKQILQAQNALDDITQSLRTDFAKYKTRVSVLRLQEIFTAVVQQAGNKFVYSKASEQIKDYQAKEALELLILAGLVLPITHTDANGIPLGAETDAKKRKILLLDTGVFQRLQGIDLSTVLLDPNFSMINKGVLAEQFWGLEFIKYAPPTAYPDLYYWHREGRSNAEIDYVVQQDSRILPIEIKASGKGQMQSLRLFLSEKGIATGYRFSTEQFGFYDNIRAIPLYAVSNFVRRSID